MTRGSRQKERHEEKNHGPYPVAPCSLRSAVPPHAQQVKERRIAVIGAPEEPRFSEVVAGLKNGLGELGYAKPSLVVQEVKIARSEEKGAKSIVEGLLRQQARGAVLDRLSTPQAGPRCIG